MTPERWKQIEQHYHAALKLEPGQRAAFLQETCAGDEDLRREVESLLAHEPQAESILESPALEVTAQGMAEKPVQSLVGLQLGSYKIVSLLGVGGMGEVYRARDTRLDRTVALKILPAEVAADHERMGRFVREAKAASALSHPNVAHIYDIGDCEGIHFIAMEYIEGETLAQRIHVSQHPSPGPPSGGPPSPQVRGNQKNIETLPSLLGRGAGGEGEQGQSLEIAEILDIAIQVADALDEAHTKGITHRDIKPGNIMLTPRGQVKVLDFGLAKVARPEGAAGSSDIITLLKTETGVVMGTVQYMSPEQVLGKEVDHRTDIFSLGVVLYEMTTGRLPFAGACTSEMMDQILHGQLEAIARFNYSVPGELERIIRKSLEKDRERRYQSARDLFIDLKNLKRDSDSGIAKASPVRSGQTETTKPKWRRPLAVVGLAALLSVILGIAIWFNLLSPSKRPSKQSPLNVVRFTSFPGIEKDPALSPDGKMVAFSWNGEKQDNFDIYVKLVNAGEQLQRLTSDPADEYSPVWSSDSRYVAYVRSVEGHGIIYSVPLFGGVERKIGSGEILNLGGIFKQFDWSPDGKFLAIMDKGSVDETTSIYLLSVETGKKTRLTFPSKESVRDRSPSFSPDGRMLSFVRENSLGIRKIYFVSVTGGEPRLLNFDTKSPVNSFAWSADGRELLVMSWPSGLFRISTAGGEPSDLGLAMKDASSVTVSRQGNLLAYEEFAFDIDLWRLEVPGSGGKPSRPVRFASSSQLECTPQFSPDGKKIAFSSERSGKLQVWICDSDGRNLIQLTSAEFAGTPRWSPDGRLIGYTNISNNIFGLYVVNAEGGTPRRLTEETVGAGSGSWSKDGNWIYFASRIDNGEIWRMPAEGGAAVQITRNGGFEPFESFDGKFLYFSKLDMKTASATIWKIPVGGSEESLVFDKTIYPRDWAVGEKGIYFIPKEEVHELLLQFFSFETGRITSVARLGKDIFLDTFFSGLAVSPDGRWVICSLAEQPGSDIMLVENFR